MYLHPSPKKKLYCYGIWQKFFDEMEKSIDNIEFYEGLPTKETLDELASQNTKVLLILDDLFNKVVSSQDIAEVFTSGCHHRGFSCIFITQNVFNQGKYARTLALNSSYLIIFRNVRDGSQMARLGRQLFPQTGKYFLEAYNDSTSTPYGYLIVDLTCSSDNRFRLRTKVFPGEECFIYVSKQ